MLKHIRNFLTTLWYRIISPHYRLLRGSGLFDAAFYYANNPDVAASRAEPLAHYLKKGSVELRQPGPLFDARYYQHQVPSLGTEQPNPLLHYLTSGRYQGRNPNPLFDTDHYCRQIGLENSSLVDPFTHFLRDGMKDERACSPSPYFDHHFYCRMYADAAAYASQPAAAYRHFLAVGRRENRQPSIYFDTPYYLDKTPALREAALDPISHYLMFGWREMKSPCPLFDPEFFHNTYRPTDTGDPFGYFLRQKNEELQPCSWFEPRFYRQTYLEGLSPTLQPLQHFLEHGLRQGLYPNREIHELPTKPVFSILVPVYNVDPVHLNNCIRSVLYQSYPHWELCLADDCSTDPRVRPLLTDWAACDPRIKIVFLKDNGGISTATNAAAQLAGGSYLAFLDNDDELAPTCLQTFARYINTDPADLYYSDENLIGADGRRFNIFRKPQFNSELLLCHNYITHCVVTRQALYQQVGGCSGEMNGAQDLDLFLRLSEQADRVIHLPEVLYHWRASASSTSINHEKKQYANEAGRKSIAKALARRGIPGEVLFTDWKFFYRAKRHIVNRLPVSLILRPERPAELFLPWLTRLLAGAGHAVSQLIVVVRNQEDADAVQTYGKEAAMDTLCQIAKENLTPGEQLGALLAGIKGELVAVVADHLEVASDQWLSALIEYGQLPDVGLVGGRIDFPEDYADLASPIPDLNNSSPYYYSHFVTDCSVLMNGRQCPQEVRGVNGDLCLVRRDVLLENFACDSASFPYLFPIVDLSFELYRQGKRNIYTPHCQAAVRADGIARRRQWPDAALQEEKASFQRKWSELLLLGDPYHNPAIASDNCLAREAFHTWLAGRVAGPRS